MRPFSIDIDENALANNLVRIRQMVPQGKILAVIKANAYSHGMVRVARVLEQADALAVACIEEAIVLRQAGIRQKIVILGGFFNEDELRLGELYQLQWVVHSEWQLQALDKFHPQNPIDIWLKLNTGMQRLGFDPQQFFAVYNRLQKFPQIGQIILMTHFSCADDSQSSFTDQQWQRFQICSQMFDLPTSVANSATIINFPNICQQTTWIRPGLILYGVSPNAHSIGLDYGLKPVMTLRSKIMAIQDCQPGDRIGYSGTYCCQQAKKIAIVAGGYADGYPWYAVNGTPVLVTNQPASLIGRVSMDMLSIDISHLSNIKVGDEVILWGHGLPVETIARCSKTIPYTLLTCVKPRS